jgi:predicted CoA-binding protein
MQTARENFARQEDINAILRMHRIAVVGLSSNPGRPSYGVALNLQSKGYEVIPVNPNETEVQGKRSYGSLLDLPEPPEVVDVFRRSEFVSGVVDDAIAAGARALWLQLGVIDYDAARRARDAGLLVVMDRCMSIEINRSR